MLLILVVLWLNRDAVLEGAREGLAEANAELNEERTQKAARSATCWPPVRRRPPLTVRP